jgi:hypothetical protein
MSVADPAVRLGALVDQLGAPSSFASVCDGDLGPVVEAVAGQMRKLLGEPCLDDVTLLDTSPAAGLQPSCEVTDIDDATPDQPVVLPSCSAGGAGGPCWALTADPVACPNSAGNLRLEVTHPVPVPPGLWTYVRCRRAA